MIKTIKTSKVKQYWKKLMDSPNRKMPVGSAYICRIISWPRCENWRRKDRLDKKSPKE